MLGTTKSPRESLEKAIELAQKAIALDDGQAAGHTSLGLLYSYKREYDKALAEGERALALNPSGADVHAYYGLILTYACRPAESYLLARSSENARSWYVIGATFTALPSLLIACALWLLRSYIVGFLGTDTFQVIIGALLGGGGALFSVLNRTQTISMDATAGRRVHYIESASRVLIGNIGALIIALAVKANILLGLTKATDHSFAYLLVICACAGASERLVSGFIKNMESSVGSSDKEKGKRAEHSKPVGAPVRGD